MDEFLLGISLIVILSIVARLIAVYVRVPAIVPLLIIGIIAGVSVTDLIDPAKLLGDSLSPIVQIAVGIILFEGALSLKREDLTNGTRRTVVRLITIGVLITWVLGSIAIGTLFDIPGAIAILIGAIIIVSGPTVVLPILDFIGPEEKVRSPLKWEGILIDPIGAIIAVTIFGSLDNNGRHATFDIVEIVLSLGTGVAVGIAAAFLMMPLLATRRLAGRDKIAATLMMVGAAFAASDALFADSGLVATIVMGMVLANQKRVEVGYIAEFKETLVPILIGVLFIMLAANVEMGSVFDLGVPALILIGILIVVVRPLVAFVSTMRLPYSWQERAFIGTMAPRGIVAASTASAFGLDLTDRGVPGAELIIPIVFAVIIGTVLFSSLIAPMLAGAWGIAGRMRPSLLLIGGPRWAVEMGARLEEAGADVRVWTEDEDEARHAQELDMTTFGGPLDNDLEVGDYRLEDLSAVALVSEDDTLNQTLSGHMTGILDADQVFRLRTPTGMLPIVATSATPMFGEGTTAAEIEKRVEAGEQMILLQPGEEMPEGATELASVKESRGPSPATVRLASDDPKRLHGPTAKLVVLAPPQP